MDSKTEKKQECIEILLTTKRFDIAFHAVKNTQRVHLNHAPENDNNKEN